MPHIAPVGDLDRASLSKVTNVVAGIASFEVGEEEGGWNQPRSIEDGSWFVFALDYMYFCTSFALYYICIYRAHI